MKDILITILRDKKTTISEFRAAADQLSLLLATHAAQHLAKKSIAIKTPIAPTTGVALKNNIVLIPILRSGIAMLQPFLHFFPAAKVGFVGLKRDEKTAIAKLYYQNLPKIEKSDDVIIIDPMLATGGSACDTLRILTNNGIREEQIMFVGIISATTGIKRIKKEFPKIKLVVAQEDKTLNTKKYIVPGLGDFGDRYFGTE